MRYAFSSNAFTGFTIEEAVRAIAGAGYEGVEVMADVPHAYPPDMGSGGAERLKDYIRDAGLLVSNVNSFTLKALGNTYSPSWIDKDPASREERIGHTIGCIELAAALGSPHISTEPGGLRNGVGREDAVDIFIKGLERVAPRARELGLRVLIEPEPGLIIESTEETLRLFERLDADVFGVNLDIGHFYSIGEDPVATIGALGGLIEHFHIEDIGADRRHHHLVPGEGAIDLGSVIGAIRKYGYNGFGTIELYTCAEAPFEAAERALAFMKNL